MNLNKLYYKETGLHSHYMSETGNKRKNKRGLVYTRKYVWWLESKIAEATKILVMNTPETSYKAFKLLKGEDK